MGTKTPFQGIKEQNMKIQEKYAHFLFFIVLILVSLTYYGQMWMMLPSGIHAWAQADRLSLAIKFYDNGMNFFRPSTFNIMSRDGVTGVEFPIQSYLAAVCGKIFGRTYISLSFRLLNTFISCIGLTFLFTTVYKRTKDFLFAAVPPLFLFCSPVFIYYTCNYLPDTAGASLILIAFYYILNYIDERKNADLIKALLWLTLASLIKTSGVIYIFGLGGFVVLYQFFAEKKHTLKPYLSVIIAGTCSVSILIAYFMYSRHVNKEYGDNGIFMAAAKPFKDWDKFSYYINHSLKDLWLKEYFVLPEYVFFLLMVVPVFNYLRKDHIGKQQLYLLLIFLIGSIGVGYLMGMQLIGHDYYVIVIFFPTIIFALLIATIMLHKQIVTTAALKPVKQGFLVSLIFIYGLANYHISQRLLPNYPPFNAGHVWAEGGNHILDSLGIPKDEKLMVLDDDAPNLALLYFDRNGYVINRDWWYGNLYLVEEYMRERKLKIMVVSTSKINMLEKEFTIASICTIFIIYIIFFKYF